MKERPYYIFHFSNTKPLLSTFMHTHTLYIYIYIYIAAPITSRRAHCLTFDHQIRSYWNQKKKHFYVILFSICNCRCLVAAILIESPKTEAFLMGNCSNTLSSEISAFEDSPLGSQASGHKPRSRPPPEPARKPSRPPRRSPFPR